MYVTGLTRFLKTLAPDFCWCSAHDLFVMAEQIPELEDTPWTSFRTTLYILKKAGWFTVKKLDHGHVNGGRIGDLYLRITPTNRSNEG